MSTMTVLPRASKTAMPLGLAPNICLMLPSGRVLSTETIFQVPTSCSASDFCWLTALADYEQSPNAVIAQRHKTLRRIGSLLDYTDRSKKHDELAPLHVPLDKHTCSLPKD